MRLHHLILSLLLHTVFADVQRYLVTPPQVPRSGARYLFVEFLQDDMVHLEVSGSRSSPPPQVLQHGIAVSPMVSNTNYPGASNVDKSMKGDGIEVLKTPKLRLEIDTNTLEVSVFDLAQPQELLLTHFSYANMEAPLKSLQMSKSFTRNIYGLGERLQESTLGSADGDFMGNSFQLASTSPFGNAAFPINIGQDWKGMSELANFPVMYAAGEGYENYALFIDNVYRKEWFFQNDPFVVNMWGAHIRFYVWSGSSLLDLRTKYLQLTGFPLVPPKRFFGMWQSIFGYRSWNHTNVDVDLLTAPKDPFFRFPVDGVAFDIYWFGGKFYGNQPESAARQSTMGSLTWDPVNFPDPVHAVESLRAKGVDVMVIEESYVSVGTSTFPAMDHQGLFARDCDHCGSSILGQNGENHWWGVGSLVDWSNPDARTFWFDCKHCPLLKGCVIDVAKCGDVLFDRNNPYAMQSGVAGFWLDLGEPEMYHDWAYYHGWQEDDGSWNHNHGDIHNLHQLFWTQGIHEGFVRHNLTQRPWTLSRSGTSGLQRYGASMWSGDIWPELANMASSLGLTKHMSMVGIDYFGSDVGGFERNFLEKNEDEKYTQWFANSAWFDVPFRPHAWQPDNSNIETAPCRVGHLPSNLFNSRQRYELLPYYYSLAHRAHLFGEPVFPPLFLLYQTDLLLRSLGHEKMIGRDILVGISATENQRDRHMYLPNGIWINYHTKEYVVSNGEQVFVNQTLHQPTYCSDDPSDRCLFVLPVFVRGGALLPKMLVDENTKNSLGERWNGDSKAEDLVVDVYSLSYDWVKNTNQSNSFVVYEDDGVSQSYLQGNVRQTLLSQTTNPTNLTVSILPLNPQTTYSGAPATRRFHVHANFANNDTISGVALNNATLTRYNDWNSYESSNSGWFSSSPLEVFAKSYITDVSIQQVFVFFKNM